MKVSESWAIKEIAIKNKIKKNALYPWFFSKVVTINDATKLHFQYLKYMSHFYHVVWCKAENIAASDHFSDYTRKALANSQ